MTTTTRTEYGFRTRPKSGGSGGGTFWPRPDGKASPYTLQVSELNFVDASDLAAMHAAVERYNTPGRAYRTEVVSRQVTVELVESVSHGPTTTVPAPVALPTTTGSVVRAKLSGDEEPSLFALVDDEWERTSYRVKAQTFATAGELQDVEVLFEAPAA